MSGPALLARLEDIIGTSGAAPRLEAPLAAGCATASWRVRTLLLGMLLALADAAPPTSPRSTRR